MTTLYRGLMQVDTSPKENPNGDEVVEEIYNEYEEV